MDDVFVNDRRGGINMLIFPLFIFLCASPPPRAGRFWRLSYNAREILGPLLVNKVQDTLRMLHVKNVMQKKIFLCFS